ncbi:MAG: hypothetical protein WB424_15805 [Terracidiphilus sp.]
MRLCLKKYAAAVAVCALLAASVAARAVSCTTQAAMTPLERNTLAEAGGRLAMAVASQDLPALKAALLPAVAADWEGISADVQAGASLLKGGQMQLRNLYLLDASTLAAPADTQFFCTSASGALTVTLTMHALPPGRYALVLTEAAGAPYAGQVGLMLAWERNGLASGWRLGGLSIRPGALDGHDGLWWWNHAREVVKDGQPQQDSWPAWFSYETARKLLLPVDFLSSPNLEKLTSEQAAIASSPQSALPLTLTEGDRNWKIDAVHLDLSMLHPDLAVVYEPTGVTDPAAVRTEATAVLTALLKAQPGLRDSFHGLSAYSLKDGKQTPVLELPMAQIP